MQRIVLINMPFSSLNLPSIGLSQIKAVLDSRFGDQVSVEILYLNHDFGRLMGISTYQSISNSATHHNSGFGDWLFRQAAFPALPDNTDEYFGRFYPLRDKATEKLETNTLQMRADLDAILDQLITTYEIDTADIVGLTSMFTQHVACLALARKLKDRNPKIVTVIGGANCESPMGQEIAKHVDYVDFLFSGPALKSFPEFVQNQIDHQSEKSHGIKGVFSKKNCTMPNPLGVMGQSSMPSGIGEELDIDVGVILDYGEFLNTLERNFPNKEVEPILLFETSRGCWWGARAHCTFCGLNGESMGYRAMSPAKAIEQFESMFKYSDRATRLNCVDNILAKNYLTEVFPHLNPPPGVNIFYEVKADLTEEDMKTLARAQVKTIQPGIESLATSTLKLMKKGTSAFQNLFFLKNCLTYDIVPEWNLLVGFPGEGEEVYKKYIQDLPLLTHLPPPSGVFPVRFDRYSPYYTKRKEYGLDLYPVDYYEMIYPFPKEALGNLAYYFSDHNFSAKYFMTMAKWLGKVRKKFDDWSALWAGKGRSDSPQLYFKENGESNVVCDSRSGELIEHHLDEATALALRYLHPKPKDTTDVARRLSHLPLSNAKTIIASLQARGLLFQEQDQFLSLVLPKAPEATEQRTIHIPEVATPRLPGMSSFQ
jgi:magnesium-protoporphyrin IX monomethyl ester (oxidative) cyclase